MFDQHRADLRIAAEWTGKQEMHVQPGFLRDKGTGSTGRNERTAGERISVESRPFRQVVFAGVMRDERNACRVFAERRVGTCRCAHERTLSLGDPSRNLDTKR